MLKATMENKAGRILYVRRKDSDTFHWHPSCSHFQRFKADPDAVKVERMGVPSGYEKCDLCLSRERREKRD